MVLDSYALEAFQAVSQHGTFTLAAKRLGITQSALSQRVAGLEEALGTTLFLRQKQGAQLTAAGKRLLLYVQAKTKLEDELVGDLGSANTGEEGTIRITGFSSVVRSVLVPALAPFLAKHTRVRLELNSREVADIAALLLKGETDFAIQFEGMTREGVRSELLGHEEYVLVEARKGPIADAFLDHDEEDEFSLRYLRRFDLAKTKILRRYLDDVYGIIDGVVHGYGRAVLPRHLIHDDNRIRILHPAKVLKVPVYLNFLEQPYYTRLQQEARDVILRGFKDRL